MESDASPARLKFFDRTKGKQCCTMECKDAQSVIPDEMATQRQERVNAVLLPVQAVFSYIQRPSTLTAVSSHQAGWCTQTSQRPARCT